MVEFEEAFEILLKSHLFAVKWLEDAYRRGVAALIVGVGAELEGAYKSQKERYSGGQGAEHAMMRATRAIRSRVESMAVVRISTRVTLCHYG